jgi:hypothetical protein
MRRFVMGHMRPWATSNRVMMHLIPTVFSFDSFVIFQTHFDLIH